MGFNSRSIVAPDAVSNCVRVCSVSRCASSPNSPCSISFGSHTGIVAARYFPDGCPASIHTLISSRNVSYPYVRGRGTRFTAFCGPRRFPAAVTCRRAFARDQPVVATSSSSIRPRTFFDAAPYSRAYFFVISRLVDIDNEPIPPSHQHTRAPEHPNTRTPERAPALREQIPNEARTPFREHIT